MHVPNWCLEVYNTRPTPIMMIHSVMSNIGLNFQVLERMGFIASVSCWDLSLSLSIYIWLNSLSFPEMLGKDFICPTLLCLFSFVSARGERDQVTASVLQPAIMYVPLNSFFLPSQECLIGKGFYLSNSFCTCFFVFMYGERKQVAVSVFQSANYLPLNSFSPFPRMLHWQRFDLSNSFVFVCLFVCLSLHIVEGMKSQPLCLHAAKHVPFPSPNVVFYWQYVWVHWCEL